MPPSAADPFISDFNSHKEKLDIVMELYFEINSSESSFFWNNDTIDDGHLHTER